MNKLLRLLGVCTIALVTLSGCREYRTEYSEVKHESAHISGKRYDPGTSGIILPDSGAFFPRKYWITFDGNIDFNVNNKNLYNKFNQGDLADVSYREMYKSIYDDINKDGQKELLKRELDGYKFIDAQPIKK